jgi:hypothetical protein
MLTRIHRALPFQRMGRCGWERAKGSSLRATRGKTWLWSSGFRSAMWTIFSIDAFRQGAGEFAQQRPGLCHRSQDAYLEVAGDRLPDLLIRAAGGRLLAASLYDGVLVEPDRQK